MISLFLFLNSNSSLIILKSLCTYKYYDSRNIIQKSNNKTLIQIKDLTSRKRLQDETSQCVWTNKNTLTRVNEQNEPKNP